MRIGANFKSRIIIGFLLPTHSSPYPIHNLLFTSRLMTYLKAFKFLIAGDVHAVHGHRGLAVGEHADRHDGLHLSDHRGEEERVDPAGQSLERFIFES